jgi:CHASE2 domain-containing sensor protein/nitrogen-specific signal transduction histidine kinase
LNSHQQRKALLRREWLLTAVIAFALLGVFVFADITKPLGNVLYDHFMRLHGFKSTQDIVIVAVDDRALANLGGWPLKREKYTRLLEALDDDRYRPKVIGFDFLFLDPTPDDAELAKQMLRLNTVLPLEFSIQDDQKQTLKPTLPVMPLANSAGIGHINLAFDNDGVIRGIRIFEKNWAHFSLELHARSNSPHPPDLSQSGYRRFRMVDPRIGFPMVSLADAIHDKFTRALLKDKYVLVGVTAPSLGDRYPTLYSGRNNASTPGVAILASVLNASLNQSFIEEASPATLFCVVLIPLLLMLQSLLILQPRYALMLAGLLIFASSALSYGLLTLMNYWIDPVPFIMVAVLLQPLWAWRRLEAIVQMVGSKAADLQQFQATERANSQVKPSREVVLQYAKLLDHAVASARSEFDFLSAVVDEIPDAVAIFDPQDQLLLCNRKIKQLVDLKQLEQGTPLAALASHLQIPISVLNELPDRSSTVPSPSVLHIHTEMGARDLLIKTVCIDSPAGGQLRLVILTDITELKQSQTQRDRALQFLSHDMRTPIASILSLTRRTSNLSETETQREKIVLHSKALLQMMDDFILTISAEAHRYKFKQELLDNLLNDAIEQVVDLADAKNVVLLDESQDSAVFVSTNTRLFVRALVNLLFNAVKFSPPDSTIRIQVTHAQETHDTVEIATISIENQVELNTNSSDMIPSMPGFGLGLDFVDTVIHKHHGTITRDIPDSGIATIRVTLPCSSN